MRIQEKILRMDTKKAKYCYATGVWVPTLAGIALLFGIGNAFDSVVSPGAYVFLLKRERIKLLDVE